MSVRILFPYLVLWVLLKVPAVLRVPQMEATWLGLGEIAVLLAGGWVLFARLADLPEDTALKFAVGPSGTRIARYLFAMALLPIGLAHLVYPAETAALVPDMVVGGGMGTFLSCVPGRLAYFEGEESFDRYAG